ncbi:MAG: type II toxin-antitoxin system RelE/ParE family toxin [Thiolinea sp.]
MKQAIFLGDSLETIVGFPPAARREAGYQINKIQEGAMPGDWKAMPTVGQGVYEIRIKVDVPREQYRVFYVARFEDAVYVLHAFQKKTQKTARKDIDRGRDVYKQLVRELKS